MPSQVITAAMVATASVRASLGYGICVAFCRRFATDPPCLRTATLLPAVSYDPSDFGGFVAPVFLGYEATVGVWWDWESGDRVARLERPCRPFLGSGRLEAYDNSEDLEEGRMRGTLRTRAHLLSLAAAWWAVVTVELSDSFLLLLPLGFLALVVVSSRLRCPACGTSVYARRTRLLGHD